MRHAGDWLSFPVRCTDASAGGRKFEVQVPVWPAMSSRCAAKVWGHLPAAFWLINNRASLAREGVDSGVENVRKCWVAELSEIEVFLNF